MKNIFKKNQVIIAALAIMIIVAGYLNFTRDKVGDDGVENTGADPAGIESQVDGDLDLVGDPDSTVTDSNDLIGVNAPTGKDGQAEAGAKAGEAVLANTTIDADFFVANKLQREQVRASNEATLQEIINSSTVSDKQKQAAIDAIIELTSIKDKENATETLLEAKGFPDTLVTITDGSVEVVVNANQLTEQQMAQIEDVVKRKTGIAAKNIVISPVNVKASESAGESGVTGTDTDKKDNAEKDSKDTAANQSPSPSADASAKPKNEIKK